MIVEKDRGAQAESLQAFLLIAFRNRNPESDERVGLVRAIQRRAIPAFCVLLRRRPLVAGPDVTPNRSDGFEQSSLSRIILLVWKHARGKKVIYLDTTGLTFPGTMLLFKLLLPRGTWVFDMNDDLLYAHTGIKRLEMSARQFAITRTSDIIVHAAATLGELFPRSHYLGNASEIGFIQRQELNYRQVVILASLDGRFDFDLLKNVATRLPGHEFHLYGRINYQAVEAPVVASALARLRASVENLVYHGEYQNHDVPHILSHYAVLFAPYRIDSHLTRYIDPIRFYAGLNSGIEVVTTPLPVVDNFLNMLHVGSSAEEIVETLNRLEQDPANTVKNSLSTRNFFSWDEKAERLINIICRSQRVKSFDPPASLKIPPFVS